MKQYNLQRPNETSNEEHACCVCFHYVFENPTQHYVEARSLVRCEMEYLVLTEEIAKLFGVTGIKIYAKPKAEGSLLDVFLSSIPDCEDIISHVVLTLIGKLVIKILSCGYKMLMECLQQRCNDLEGDHLSILREILKKYSIDLSIQEVQILEVHQDIILKKSALCKFVGKDSKTSKRALRIYEERFSCIYKRFHNSVERDKTINRIDVTISEWTERIHNL